VVNLWILGWIDGWMDEEREKGERERKISSGRTKPHQLSKIYVKN
jgi:hypothetical protein